VASEILNFMKYILRVLFPFVILGSIISCEEDVNIESRVVTEEILFIGSDKVRMSGRVLAISNAGIQDHGFFVADDENFTSPIIVSLGEKSIPGRFIGETANLELKSNYFIKSYISSNGKMSFGNTIPFTTLAPFIKDFSPRVGVAGQVIQITGGNFNDATEVFLGGAKGVIDEIEFESIIKFKVPDLTGSVIVDIKVVLGSEVLTFTYPFEYIIGKWEQVGTFIDNNNYFLSFFFQSENKLIFGLGTSIGTGENDKIWKLDFNSWAWSEIPFTGTTVTNAFAVNGFFGSGINNSLFGFVPTNEFWKFNASTETFEQLGILPFGFSKGVGSVLNNELYLFGGIAADLSDNFNYYKYDETTGSWSLLGTAPIVINKDYPTFQFNNSVFFINEGGGVYRYIPVGDSWAKVSQYPETVGPFGMSIVLNNKAYIGLFINQRRIWEYDPILNTWKKKISYPQNIRNFNAAWWTHNNMIYVMRSDISSLETPMQIWSFDPEGF